MLTQKLLSVLLALFVYMPSALSQIETQQDEVLRAVSEMNSAWQEQDLSRCMSYFTLDTKFENSFGWSLSGKAELERFLGDFLFAHYPKTVEKYVKTSSKVEFLSSKLALVEEAKRIDPQDKKQKPRFVRTNYILNNIDGRWLIWKTQSWTPKFHRSPPKNFVLPNRFPEVFCSEDC